MLTLRTSFVKLVSKTVNWAQGVPFHRVVLSLWLCYCVVQTKRYVPVWHSDFTLWSYAVERAPLLPRALINYGKVVIASGERDRGRQIALRGYNIERGRQDAARADRAHPR